MIFWRGKQSLILVISAVCQQMNRRRTIRKYYSQTNPEFWPNAARGARRRWKLCKRVNAHQMTSGMTRILFVCCPEFKITKRWPIWRCPVCRLSPPWTLSSAAKTHTSHTNNANSLRSKCRENNQTVTFELVFTLFKHHIFVLIWLDTPGWRILWVGWTLPFPA